MPPEHDYEAAHRIAVKRAKFYNEPIPVGQHAPTPEGEAYRQKIARLNQSQPTQLDSILSRILTRQATQRPQALSPEVAETVVVEIYRAELARRNRSLAFTDEQKEVIRNVVRYFNGDPDGPYPLHKGLFIYGDVGVGKTFLLDCMAVFCKAVPIDGMSFRKVRAKALVEQVVGAKSIGPISNFSNGHLLYDDLGDEKLDITLYGKDEAQRYNVTDMLLSTRYEHFVRAGQLTHFTSNMQLHAQPGQIGEIESRYGTRLYDRISEMTTSIYLPGTSKRE